jgi:hypothetical protein
MSNYGAQKQKFKAGQKPTLSGNIEEERGGSFKYGELSEEDK